MLPEVNNKKIIYKQTEQNSNARLFKFDQHTALETILQYKSQRILLENTFDRKRISANTSPNPDPNPKAQ